MVLEVYNSEKAEFRSVIGGERVWFKMPELALLDVRKAAKNSWMTDLGVSHLVIQDPPAYQIFRDSVLIESLEEAIFSFPPAGWHYIYTDGHTEPPNLRALIQARVSQGWTVTPTLEALLA